MPRRVIRERKSWRGNESEMERRYYLRACLLSRGKRKRERKRERERERARGSPSIPRDAGGSAIRRRDSQGSPQRVARFVQLYFVRVSFVYPLASCVTTIYENFSEIFQQAFMMIDEICHIRT